MLPTQPKQKVEEPAPLINPVLSFGVSMDVGIWGNEEVSADFMKAMVSDVIDADQSDQEFKGIPARRYAVSESHGRWSIAMAVEDPMSEEDEEDEEDEEAG